jgi:iron complex outermembrane receptor protein
MFRTLRRFSFAEKRIVKRIFILCLLALNFTGFAQNGWSNNPSANQDPEPPRGVIAGQVNTTDNKPAAFVSVFLKGTSKATATDEQGSFLIRNLKEGVYILEVSMVGLKTQERTVELKKDEVFFIAITLVENAQQLSEVVVTAGKSLNDRRLSIGKLPIDPMDLPQSVGVIGQAVIRDQQAQRLSDVVKNINGVYLSSTRGSTQETFAARGYNFGSYNLFKNGARVNSGIMPEMNSLERVEVLKGSAAILYGQVAPGGVLNMVTKEPKFQWGGELSMRTGSYGLYKPAFDIYGPLSSSVAFRLNAAYETSDSYRDGVHSRRYYVNPSFLFRLGKRTDLIVEGDYLCHHFTPDFGIGTTDNTRIPDLPRSRFLGTSWQYCTSQQSTATTILRHQLSDSWKLNGSLSYQYYNRNYYSTERIQAAANGDWTRLLGRTLTSEKYFTGQVNLTGKFSTASLNHSLLAGMDGDHYTSSAFGFSYPSVASLPAGGYDRINVYDLNKYVQRSDIPLATRIRKTEAPLNRFGVYVQDLVKLSNKFNLLAGIRWSYLETVAIDSTNLLTGSRTRGKTRFDKAFSPHFGIVYKPWSSTSLFASYSNSFTVNTGSDIDGNPLKPSLIDQFEIGIKNDFFRGRLSANLTVYRIVNNNLAQTAPALRDGSQNNNTGIKVLTGQTTSDGVELDLGSHPVFGLDILAGYSYTYARYTRTSDKVGSFITGERVLNTPSHTANGSLFYTFSSFLKGLKLGASVFYTGKRMAGFNNAVGQAQTYSRLFAVKGFTTADISAGYAYKKISVLAKLSNIANTFNYIVHENYSVNPIAPRQLMATISYKF